jgi:hypothetical protein
MMGPDMVRYVTNGLLLVLVSLFSKIEKNCVHNERKSEGRGKPTQTNQSVKPTIYPVGVCTAHVHWDTQINDCTIP